MSGPSPKSARIEDFGEYDAQGNYVVGAYVAGKYVERILPPADIPAWRRVAPPKVPKPATPVAAAIPTPERFPFQSAAGFAVTRSFEWIVKDVLPKSEIAMIFGESGSGKSFFTLDLVASIALGAEWRGKRVKQGRVAYIAAEGANGFRNRLAAYAKGREVPLAKLDLHVLDGAPNLTAVRDVTDLIAAVQALGPLAVLVVDTLSVTTAGASENDGADMGKALGHCKALHRASGALVILVHHSGKDASRGARGWSGIRAAVDAEIEISSGGHDRVAVITKQKDGEGGAEYGFKLLQVPVGMDGEGEIISSCVVEYTRAVERHSRVRDRQLGDVERVVWQALSDLVGTGEGDAPSVTEVVAAAALQMVHAGDKRDTRSQRAMRALEGLRSAGRVKIDGGLVTRVD